MRKGIYKWRLSKLVCGSCLHSADHLFATLNAGMCYTVCDKALDVVQLYPSDLNVGAMKQILKNVVQKQQHAEAKFAKLGQVW